MKYIFLALLFIAVCIISESIYGSVSLCPLSPIDFIRITVQQTLKLCAKGSRALPLTATNCPAAIDFFVT